MEVIIEQDAPPDVAAVVDLTAARPVFPGKGFRMLVLSRRPGQKIVFPGLGIAIEVLCSRGAVTRLGISAPEDVAVVRDEVLERTERGQATEVSALSAADRERRHEWRNKLNQLMLKLELIKGQLELGRAINPEQQLSELFSELTTLEQATADAAAQRTSLRILIVEDQANERELLADCLRLKGIEVATAGNGREAFDYLHEHDLPDLILLDMRMPEIDGPTFLNSVRDNIRLRNLRVFAVSGSLRSEFEADLLPLDGWISKPVRIDALIQAVQHQKPQIAVTA